LVPSLSRRLRLRSQLLQAIATVNSLAALSAMLDPDRTAAAMGLFLVGVNGYSQFYAIYVGVRLATAGLALFILAQPLGRFIASFAIGLPQGLLFVVSGIELLAGLALLLLRPRGKLLSP
jgi:hypothetical protein